MQDQGYLLACPQTGTPLGDNRFFAQIERALGVQVGYSCRGRPKRLAPEPALDRAQMKLGLGKGI